MKSIRIYTAFLSVIVAEWLRSAADKAHGMLFAFMVNQGLVKCATNSPFPIQPDLTNIAVAYRNKNMIADSVLPRVPVAKQDFRYFKWALAEGFTVPETLVGRRSPPNQVEFTGSQVDSSTFDYALDDSIPNVDIENAGGEFDPVARATLYTTNLLELDREVRAANLVFGSSNYAAGNQSTLSGTGQWSDYTNSNPFDAITAALDTMIMRPNVGVMGRAVWTKFRQNPKVLAALGMQASGGVATREQVAALLEIDELYVGESWVNSAKKGQTPTMARVWGKHAAFMVRDQLADTDRGVSFGLTAQFGSRIAGSFEDKDIGMRGGTRVRVGESVREILTANDLGYLFINAVA